MSEQRWPDLLATLLAGGDLDADACGWALGEILAGNASPVNIASFAIALRAKGETAAELGGLVAAMLAAGTRLPLPADVAGRRLVDTCGTGGDRRNTVNISTMAALVVAGAGETVVKHGNRAASSSAGSADVLEALGIPIALTPEGVARCVTEAGIGFCFAPVFHPAMRHAGPTRGELGVPTFFNILGPLANPAQPAVQLVGVADGRLAPLLADVLAARGVSALVVRGEEGLDELTLAGPSQVWEVRDGAASLATLTPEDAGIGRAPVEALVGGDAAANAEVARRVLAGDERGPIRDAVVLNAAAALVAAAPTADGPLAGRLAQAAVRAAAALDTGAAAEVLERWRAVAEEVAPSA